MWEWSHFLSNNELFRVFIRDRNAASLAGFPPLRESGGRLAENAPEVDFLPAILPGSLDLLLG